MSVVLEDLRHALRALRRNPGFTVVAILTLALGIGANSTIFSLVNGVLLKPPIGVRDPARVVSIYTSDYSSGPYGTTSYPDFQAVRAETAIFSAVAVYELRPLALALGDRAEMITGQLVSGEFFPMLGTRPAAGRLLIPADAGAGGGEAVAVISHGLWLRRFAGDPAIAGRELRLNGRAFRVVGVAPAGFTGLLRAVVTDVWLPVTAGPLLDPGSDELANPGARSFLMAARLRAGVTVPRARQQLAAVARARFEAFPDAWATVTGAGRALTVLPEAEARVPPQARTLSLGASALLLVAMAMVLLIACANIANLLLARASRRRREMAVRVSLGAARHQIVRQLLVESMLLAVLGAAAGLALAGWITGAITTLALPGVPVTLRLDLGLDGRVLGFTAVVALLTGLAFGLLPALRASRSDVVSALKGDVGGVARSRRLGLRGGLVVTQVAVSLVLLVTAGLFVRSLTRAETVDPGFDESGTALITFDLASSGYAEGQGQAFYNDLLERVRALPGVRSATLAQAVPLATCCNRRGTRIEGYAARPGESTEVNWNIVATDYFRTLRIPFVLGRDFTERDRADAPLVAIVNEAFVRKYWPGRSPLGRRIDLGGRDSHIAEVVGVVRNGMYRSLGEAPLPFLYVPLPQLYRPSMTLHVRTAGDPSAMLPTLRAQIRELAPSLPLIHPTTLREATSLALWPHRLGALLLGALGAIAALLAALGLYGVLAYSVAQRTREFGIRGALGADRRRLVAQVIREGLVLSGTGAAIGLVLAGGATRLVRGFLFGVSPFDPAAFGAVTLLVAAIALLASYLPARRATRVDPMEALRHE
jgi:predicted permease